jgi:hypothetical protein
MSLPEIAQLVFDDAPAAVSSASTVVHKTFDWDFEAGDFRLKDGKLIELTDLDYLRVWVQKALLSNREIPTLIGYNLHPDYTRAELERMVTETLMANEAVTAVENFSFSQEGARLTVSFDVSSIFGISREAVIL